MRVPAVLTAAIVVAVLATTPAAYGVSTGQPAATPTTTPTTTPTAPAKPSHNVTFGAGPATKGKHGRPQLDGRPYYTYDASPGGLQNDEIGIINFAHKKQVLNVYTVDATSATNGDFTYSAKATKPKDAGAWLAVGTKSASGRVVVKPRSRTFLPVHLRVPTNAQPGDHAAAIIVSLTGLVRSKSGQQRVNLEQRVATRVIVRVSGDLHPQLVVQNLHVSYKGTTNPLGKGTATVHYTVANTGNAVLGATQQVEIKGLFGTTTKAPALPGVPALLPGGSYPVTATIGGVFPEIHMTATVHVTPAGLQGAINPGLHPFSTSTGFWAIPWLLILIILVLILALVAYIAVRRRRSRAPGRHRDAVQPATPATGSAPPEGAPS